MATPIRLIAALGNPGREHERDRHNAGFWFAERLAEVHRVALKQDVKYHGVTGKLLLPGHEAWIVLPQTYMNLSGRAVGTLSRFYKIAAEEILVVHDELDFPPGAVKLKFGGGVAGHNGLKDISAALGGPGFWRLRLGIGHPGDRDKVADYVLSRPPAAERGAIDEAIDKGLQLVPMLVAGHLEAAMLKLHTKTAPS